MKKRIYLLSVVALLVGCNNANSGTSANENSNNNSTSSNIVQNLSPKIIVPNGTPAVGIANYAVNHLDDVEVVSGPKLLAGAFAAKEKDIIIAPINLGATRYNSDTSYSLYRTLVWDNIYILSRSEIKTINDIKDKNITSFGKGSTPEIVLNTILNKNNISANVEYLDNAVLANTMFVDNQSDIVITAQPNLSAVDTTNAFVTPLNKFWKEATGLDSYPQSGIFIKNSEFEALKTVLGEIDQAIDEVTSDVAKTAKNGEIVTGTFKEALLNKAIPQCGYKTFTNEKELLDNYFQTMIDIGMASSIGGKKPDASFYIEK